MDYVQDFALASNAIVTISGLSFAGVTRKVWQRTPLRTADRLNQGEDLVTEAVTTGKRPKLKP